MIALPVPVPAGAPPWIGVLFVLAGAAVLAVLIWQAVRYFRDDRADRDKQARDEHGGEHDTDRPHADGPHADGHDTDTAHRPD